MKIKKFTINNYRAINEIEFKLNFSINPIIGVNEAGKTSILKAILAFDTSRDKFNAGEHLDYKNKYHINKKDCSISAIINLDKTELVELIEKLNLKTDSEDYKIISRLGSSFDFELTRNLTAKKNFYSLEIENVSEKTLDNIAKFLISKIPYILYFDDFADRVPDSVEFPENYVNDSKLTNGKKREWQEIIQEIFKRADAETVNEHEDDIPLIAYLKVNDKDLKSDILSDVQQTLNKEIISEWIRIKNSGNSFADDSDKLELVIDNDGNDFKFKVKDKSNEQKSRTFDISERSKGFQWFFNYMVKLKFNPNYKGVLENSIFLLDEPGSYLHSSAQSELLKELHLVSEKNTIIYCTHSQYLLNPDVIKIGSIKIAEKNAANIKLSNFGEFKTTNDRGALSPIYQALQLNFSNEFLGKIVITEGVIDYYFFKMIQNHTSFIPKDIKFIPGSGASQSSTLISLAISFSKNYIIFLDNDKAGKAARKKYIKTFDNNLDNHIHVYTPSKPGFELEDFLCEIDRKSILSITKSKDLKRAFGFLFYDYKKYVKEFIKNLDKETIKNLESTFEALSKL